MSFVYSKQCNEELVMAQEAPIFENLVEFIDLATKVVSRYPEKFSGVDMALISAVQITNKEPKEGKDKFFEILPVKMPVRLDCKFAYYIIVYQCDWESRDEAHKLALIAQSLHAIPLDENGSMDEGAVNSFDMKDFAPMLRTFGTDYHTKANIPNLLKDEVKWID